MAERKTIYLPDPVVEYLADAESLSGRISGVILRYKELCARHLPQLTRNEWCAICDANNGCGDIMDEHPDLIVGMQWANVADSPGLGAKWGINQAALVTRMRKWTYAETVAAFEAVRTFWLHTDKPTDAALKIAGVDSNETGC